MSVRPELESRLEQPNFVLWFGRQYQGDSELESDLERLRISAVMISHDFPALEGMLRRQKLLSGQWPVFIANREELQAWDRRGVPVVLLDKETKAKSERFRLVERTAMSIDTFKRIVDRLPIVLAVGVDTLDEVDEILEAVGDQDPSTPVLLLGVPPRLGEGIEQLAARTGVREVFIRADSGWSSFRAELIERGRLLTYDEEAPAVLVAPVRVSLAELFQDPIYRLDSEWRIVSTRATAAFRDGGEDLNALFRAFMQLDERRDALRVEDDIKEWRAVAGGIPYVRQTVAAVRQQVLAQLGSTVPGAPSICWLPAEPGSGATSALHMIAFEAARLGHPTLVLKQVVRQIKPEQVADFLFALNQRAEAIQGKRTPHERRPAALVVLDVDHAGATSIERLPEYLSVVRSISALVLWAVRIPFGDETDFDTETNPVLRAQIAVGLFEGLRERIVSERDTILPSLRARVTELDVKALEQHIAALRKRGISIVERDVESFYHFQEQNRAISRRLSIESSTIAKPDGEDLFWILLYHFLSVTSLDPISEALNRRIERFLEAGRSFGFKGGHTGVLLLTQVAKTSLQSVAVPQSALSNWLQSQQARPAADAHAVVMSGVASESSGVLDLAAQLKLAWTGSRAPAMHSESTSSQVQLRRLLNQAAAEGLVRLADDAGTPKVVFIHRVIARLFLAALIRDFDETFRDAVDEIVSALDSNRAHSAFRSLLSVLGPSTANIRFLEELSESCLLGVEKWAGWHDGRGEDRLDTYQTIPEDLRRQSRVLQHHYALALRRSTFWAGLANETKTQRLNEALEHLKAALEMPWARRERDEHPAHLQTTIGWVYDTLSHLDPARRVEYRLEARQILRDAVAQLPESRHARFVLARLLFGDAKSAKESGAIERSADIVSECLRLLSVRPTAREEEWHSLRATAARLVSDEEGRRLIERLKSTGLEDGFLLEAELLIANGDETGAIRILNECLQGQYALRRPRAARRYLELAAIWEGTSDKVKRQYELLKAVEASGVRMSPMEEYQLAVLEFQTGEYESGRRRFARLRQTQRAYDIESSDIHYIVDSDGNVREWIGTVETVEPTHGQMRVTDPSTGRRVFSIPFQIRHFVAEGKVVAGKQYPIVVRLRSLGPVAIPKKFISA